MSKIGFIGMGNMGTAILKGIVNMHSEMKSDICFFRNNENRAKELEKELGVSFFESNIEVVKKSKYIILAVKPQMFHTIAKEIKSYLGEDKILISLAPSFSIAQLKEMFGAPKIIRVMPNTPYMVSEGMAGVCFEEGLSEEEFKTIEIIFGSAGKMQVVDEKIMNSVVCASGSSPAYVFMFIEALADSAVRYGMPRAKAYEFVAQTVLGSAKMVLETGKHPGELKDMVCSPGGTTIAGVEALEQNNFRGSVFEATKACFDKCNNMK